MFIRWAKTYILLKNAHGLVVVGMKTGLEVQADKTKYVIMSRDQNAGRSHDIKFDNSSSDCIEQLKYFGITLTNPNYIQEELENILNSGNACCHWCSICCLSFFCPKI
jgi:hypothetical protein